MIFRNIFKIIVIVSFSLMSINCKTQINTSEKTRINELHNIIGKTINDIVDDCLENPEFSNWNNSDNKILILSKSKKDSIIRAIPLFNEEYMTKNIGNDYSAWSVYRNTNIIFWGDCTGLFESKTTNKKLFFDKNTTDLILGEFYGSEFTIKDTVISNIETRYFDNIIIE